MKSLPRNGQTLSCPRSKVASKSGKLPICWFELMIEGHAVIKNKAFAFPEAFILRNLLKVFQDASPKMVNLLEPLLEQKTGCFLTANPPVQNMAIFWSLPGSSSCSTYSGKSLKSSVWGSSACLNVPISTSKSLRVSITLTSGLLISAFQSLGST